MVIIHDSNLTHGNFCNEVIYNSTSVGGGGDFRGFKKTHIYLQFIKFFLWVGRMVQLAVGQVPSNHEDLSSDHWNPCKTDVLLLLLLF